jgi:transposase
MLTVDDYGTIRRAHRDGGSIRKIARQTEHSRNTIRKVLRQAEPDPLPTPRNRAAPVLGPVQAIIDQILRDDEDAPPKQRHTAAQLWRRLCDEHGYKGCYGHVQRYIRSQRRNQRETFIPLGHLPGQRLEADFGHIHVDFPDGQRLVPFLVATWAYSNAPFVLALPFERTEAILAGMVAAFEYFGRVPKEVWWDNPKTVAAMIFPGRKRQLHPRYAALASHYVFDPQFCLPARGNEKPDAESTVKAVQRRFATPVPRVHDLDELNAALRRRCEAEHERTVDSLFGPFRIAARFAEEKAAARRLPERPFDACVIRTAADVDKYQTVAFDNSRYSVPRAYAFTTVAVKGYIDRVVIVARGQVIASHARNLGEPTLVLEPRHYLASLGTRPAALDHSPVFRDWKLPDCFGALRRALEEQHGALSGSRRYVRVLQLLADHPLSRVREAIETCRESHMNSMEAVIQRTRVLAALSARADGPAPAHVPAAAPALTVPRPDLGRFNLLLDGPADARAGEGTSVAAIAARTDDAPPGACGVLCT